MPTRTNGTRLVLATIFFGLCGCKDAPRPGLDDPAVKRDLARFRGTWAGKTGPGLSMAIEWTFDGPVGKERVTSPLGRTFDVLAEIRLNPNAKPFSTIDFISKPGPDGDKGPDAPGIYRFEDEDTLILCYDPTGEARPSKLSTNPEKTLTLKRKN